MSGASRKSQNLNIFLEVFRQGGKLRMALLSGHGTQMMHSAANNRANSEFQCTLRYHTGMFQAGRKVLFLDQYGDIGGGQRILLDLARFARREGWEVTVLCPDGPLTEMLRSERCSVHILRLPFMSDGAKGVLEYLRSFLFSRNAAKTFHPLAKQNDLVVVNGLRTLGIARLWSKQLEIPTILYLHGAYVGFQRVLISSFLRRRDTWAIAPSALVAAPFISRKNISIIPNWFSDEFISEPTDRMILRSVLGIHDDFPLILVPGRYSPNKGQRIVLEVSALLSDIRCHFVFAGASLFEQQGVSVEREIRAAAGNSPQRIHLLSWQRSLPHLFDGADLVVVPSLWNEPFGLTAIESMARSRPLIVSDRGTLPLLAEGGRFAEVASPDSDSIAKCIRDFLGHREAWGRRAEESRVHVIHHFGPGNRAQALALFNQMIP